jgi:hypothetical protein
MFFKVTTRSGRQNRLCFKGTVSYSNLHPKLAKNDLKDLASPYPAVLYVLFRQYSK